MKMKSLGIAVVALLAAASAVVIYEQRMEDERRKAEGEKLIERVEEHRRLTGRLPDVIADLGLDETMGVGPCYERIDSAVFMVYFSLGFDGAFAYRSDTGEWSYER